MTEKQAYAKGYAAGLRRSWPQHRPPTPPEPVVARLLAALTRLRNQADWICATLDEDDDLVAKLGPAIDEADAAMVAVTQWLKQVPAPEGDPLLPLGGFPPGASAR